MESCLSELGWGAMEDVEAERNKRDTGTHIDEKRIRRTV